MRKAITATILIAIALAGLWWWLSSTPDHEEAPAEPTSANDGKAPDLPNPDQDKPIEPLPLGQLPAVRDIPVEGQPAVTNQQQAQDVIDQQELGLGEDSRLQVSHSTTDEYGNSYYEAEQTYKGLPVFGSRALLEIEHGTAQVLNGIWVEQIELDIEPDHTAAEALRLALDHRGVPGERTVSVLGEPQLLVFVTDQGPTLCWRLTATLSEPDTNPERYLVDAHSPVIYLQEPVLQR